VRGTVILIKVKSCITFLLMLLVCICSYPSLIQRYKFLILILSSRPTIYAWARMWGYMAAFWTRRGSASKVVWERLFLCHLFKFCSSPELLFMLCKRIFISLNSTESLFWWIILNWADLSAFVVKGVGLWPLNRCFESCWEHGCLSLVLCVMWVAVGFFRGVLPRVCV